MKGICSILLLCLLSCNYKKLKVDAQPLSKAQLGIQSIVDSFKTDCSKGVTKRLYRDYDLKISRYLANVKMDSFLVHVDTVIIEDLLITTKFHSSKNVEIQYGMRFVINMDPKWDSIYNFMKHLKVGSDTLVGFIYMGSHQLNVPGSNSETTLKIFAFPVPCSSLQ